MLYKVYTKKLDWCKYYFENILYIIAESEEEAKEIYKKKAKVGRKKIYADKSNKKGIVTFA